ncbi:MAG: response regulator [Bacteroidetes bacterium]|nr:response regulator [Bacteroidota bacterium]
MNDLKNKADILIVDDHPANLQLLANLLRDEDYKVRISTNGKLALKAIDNSHPHLILLDINMPEMDGFEVCKVLKKNETTREIPIIFMTAQADVKDKVKGFELGALDYITKPIQIEEVLARVRTHITLFFLQREMKNINQILEGKVRQRTEELEIALDKAEESSKIKSHFLALMSHELRTPLAGIIGLSEIIKEEEKNPELKEFSDSIYNAGTRLKDTLNAILDLSRLATDKKQLDFIKVDITERVGLIVKSFKDEAKFKNLNLNFINKSGILFGDIDKTMFDIVINNIISNAIKYSKEGNIQIRTSSDIEDGYKWITIEVEDTGIGIPEDKLEIIFDEYRQADEGMKRNFEGVGLGLTIAKQYTEIQNGKISVVSQLGKGSTFTLKFPLNSSGKTVSLTEEKQFENTGKLNTKKKHMPNVLLVENDDIILNVTDIFLKNICNLKKVKCGEDAVKSVEHKKFDIILMDISLGLGIDGIAAKNEIRKKSGYQNIPIVAFTAQALEGDKERILKEGFTHYLPKPFSKGEITKLMEDIFNDTLK